MSTRIYRIFLLLQRGPLDSRRIVDAFGLTSRAMSDTMKKLTHLGIVERDPASDGSKLAVYRLTGKGSITPDGRGHSEGSALGRQKGPPAAKEFNTGRKRRSAIPRPSQLTALEQAWPSVVRVRRGQD